MSRHLFLGLAAGIRHPASFLFTIGSQRDTDELKKYLAKRYGGQAILTKNGRSALALALKAYLRPGEGVIINGFTCYAVYEAVKAAGLTPVFADICEENLNFTEQTLSDATRRATKAGISITGIVVQNSLGHPVDIEMVERFAKKHQLTIIEDLAHSAGTDYPDGREAGTIGSAAILSFGKEKSVDTTSGGAVVLRHPCNNPIKAPSNLPKKSDTMRARWYPILGCFCRGLARIRLGGVAMRALVKLHFVERSADNRLDLECGIANFEAKLALAQLKKLHHARPLRDFYIVRDREATLAELKKHKCHFDGFWYERPISPARYYDRVHFPEQDCPVATEVAKRIVNLPSYYNEKQLKTARTIIERHV